MAATIVPKGPRAQQPPAFDRDAALARLFALPLPPVARGGRNGRTYPITTPLGRVMRLRGLQVIDLARIEGCPPARRMSDYLADRTPIPPADRVTLGRALRVDPRIF